MIRISAKAANLGLAATPISVAAIQPIHKLCFELLSRFLFLFGLSCVLLISCYLFLIVYFQSYQQVILQCSHGRRREEAETQNSSSFEYLHCGYTRPNIQYVSISGENRRY